MKYQIKEIPGFPGYYVSTEGEVFSDWHLVPTGRGNSAQRGADKRLLKPSKKKYLEYCLYINGKKHFVLGHRLILLTFKGACPDNMQACHNNGNSSDNRLENLRWDTAKNNCADRYKHGTFSRGEDSKRAKLNEKQVRVIKHILTIPNRISHKRIAKIFRVERSTVTNINRGVSWKHITI